MLSSLRSTISTANSSTRSFFSSPAEVDGPRGSTAASFSAVRRRLGQLTLQTMGKASASPDAEFAAHTAQLGAIDALVRDVRADAQACVEGVRRSALASARLGAAARGVGGAGFGRSSEAFARALEAAPAVAAAPAAAGSVARALALLTEGEEAE